MKDTVLRATCPSCGRKFRGIEPIGLATTVHERTCRNPECRETWQVIVRPVKVWAGGRIDRLDLTFVRSRMPADHVPAEYR